jgi:single-strand DNA-binding protein
MNYLNMVMVEGNVVKSPTLRFTHNGDAVCAFVIASNRFHKGKDGMATERSFFPVEAWLDVAKKCDDLAKKGVNCRIQGRLRQDRWENPDGEPRSKVVIVADKVEFRAEKKEESHNDSD